MFCFNKKTAYEMRISDWRSDVFSSDLTSDILKLTLWAEARARRAEPRGDVAGIVQAVEEQVILDDRPGQLSDHLAPLVLIVIIVREQRVGRIRFESVRLPVELDAAVELVRARLGGRVDERAGRDRKSTRLNSSHYCESP